MPFCLCHQNDSLPKNTLTRSLAHPLARSHAIQTHTVFTSFFQSYQWLSSITPILFVTSRELFQLTVLWVSSNWRFDSFAKPSKWTVRTRMRNFYFWPVMCVLNSKTVKWSKKDNQQPQRRRRRRRRHRRRLNGDKLSDDWLYVEKFKSARF